MSASGLAIAQTATPAISSARIVFGRARMVIACCSELVVANFAPPSADSGFEFRLRAGCREAATSLRQLDSVRPTWRRSAVKRDARESGSAEAGPARDHVDLFDD